LSTANLHFFCVFFAPFASLQTTPALRATPPKEGNFTLFFSIPLLGGVDGAAGRGGSRITATLNSMRFFAPFVHEGGAACGRRGLFPANHRQRQPPVTTWHPPSRTKGAKARGAWKLDKNRGDLL